MEKGIENIIIDNKEIKDKYNVKSILIRFIFTNTVNENKIYNVKITKLKDLNELNKLNSFIPDKFEDKVDEKSYQNFYNINRIDIDLPFQISKNIAISIDLKNLV